MGRAVRGAVGAVLIAGLLASCSSGKVDSRGPAPQASQPAPSTVPLPPPIPPLPIPTAPDTLGVSRPGAEDTVRVALLVPLSGPNAAIGRALLDAAQLALFDVADDPFVLVPRDTGTTPEDASRAADSAISEGARLIIGPLFAADAPVVAQRARAAGVNMVSLSNDRTIAAPDLFILGLTPQSQIARVIDFARSRGLNRYAALLPNNAFGAATEEAARAAAAQSGGQVVAVERYDPATTDASPVVRRLAAYESRRSALLQQRRALETQTDEASKAQLRALSAEMANTDPGFDSVLLPDFGDRLLQIAPLLPYFDIDPQKVRYLGSALWEDQRLTREPAMVGGWFAAPPPQARAGFLKRFRDVYGRDPPRIATLAYDAVALAAVLAREEEGPDFSIKALTNPAGFAGMDGIFRLKADGTVERGLAVLEIRRDGFRIVSPAPEAFTGPLTQ
jgi:ABC-type branched-subunit amino acid transport system substrate-binding protein